MSGEYRRILGARILRSLLPLFLALTVTGCGSAGIQPGEHVTVYVSMPMEGPNGADGQDVVRGAELALSNAPGGPVGKLGVHAVYMNDATRAGWSAPRVAQNARRATEDSTSIAYIGDFDSGATRTSLPITNEASLLQVSPASSAVDLTRKFLGAGDEVPDVQPTGNRTFGRVIPGDEVQAEAAADWAKHISLKGIAAVSDGSQFGRTLVEAFRNELGPGELVPIEKADVVYYGGAPDDVPPDLDGIATGCPGRAVLASDALIGTSAASRLAPPPGPYHCPNEPAGKPVSPGGLQLTSSAQDPSQLPPLGGQLFVKPFRGRYGREPGRYAAYGYEAMAVVLDSIRRAGGEGDERQAVTDAFFDTSERDSILGTYSIDAVGDTTLKRLALYAATGTKATFIRPLEAP